MMEAKSLLIKRMNIYLSRQLMMIVEVTIQRSISLKNLDLETSYSL